MKKTIKIVALSLSLLALTVLFTGCDALDEMQANHALLSEDRKTISFKGETYKLLSDADNIFTSEFYGYPETNIITVTDEDVPVLLSNVMSHTSEYDKLRDIITVSYNFDINSFDLLYGFSYEYSGYGVYCNEKDYEMYTDVIENATLDRIGFQYERRIDGNYDVALDVGSEALSKEIFWHINNSEKMTKDIFEECYYEYETIMYGISKCDSEGILCEILDGYDIYKDYEGNAYLLNYTIEKGVKLSDSAASELKKEYFYGYDPFYIY